LLYQLAAGEYPASASECNASQGAISSPACVFYDVNSGSTAQPCSVAHYASNAAGSLPASTCGSESGDATGIMEVAGAQSYAAGVGYDIATGLGSIDAGALIAAVQGTTGPRNLQASTSGQTVTLTWMADPSATQGYDIYQGSGAGPVSSTPVQRNVMAATATIGALDSGQAYEFAVAAVSSSGVSPLSAPAQVTLVPAAPTGVAVAADANGDLNVTWTASHGATSYDVFLSTTSGGEGSTPAATVSTTSASLISLVAGQKYFVTVTALDAGGSSAPSAEASGTMIPLAPSGLTATPGNGTVSLTWSAATGATSYTVFQSLSSSPADTSPVLKGITTVSATVSGLANGTTYVFYVAAADAGGLSAPSNDVTATPNGPKSGGGGSTDGLLLGALAALAAARAARISSRRTPS
jgi:hypothetical protein